MFSLILAKPVTPAGVELVPESAIFLDEAPADTAGYDPAAVVEYQRPAYMGTDTSSGAPAIINAGALYTAERIIRTPGGNVPGIAVWPVDRRWQPSRLPAAPPQDAAEGT